MKQINLTLVNTLLLLGIYVAGWYVYQRIQNVENQIGSVTQPAQNLLNSLGL